MPWCEPCGRYLTPNAVATDGACPSCGQAVEPAPTADSATVVADRVKVPWHFWLILALASVYLGWRAIQGIALLF